MARAALPQRPESVVGGKYRLASRLAAGGMGEVWVARNEATGADVAVKLCRSDVPRAEAVARFRQEARLGAMLSHRSIVRVFDLVEEPDGTLIVVMELLRGETLEDYLRTRGQLTQREAIAIALPILSALAHAHDLGIVHRDVTPANIFLAVDPDGQVIPKLVDFGIAKLPASGFQTVDGRVLGTPRYMSPEQIRAQGDVDGRSDLFGVAVVLYEMVTGSCPFAAKSASASLAAVLEDVVDPDPRIEPAVWLELQRALSKRPYERHGSAQDMAEKLRRAAGDADAELAQLLRRSPPSRDREGHPWVPGRSTPSDGGPSVGSGATVHSKRRARAGWVLGALLLCLAATGIVTLRLTRASRQAIDPPATTSPLAPPPPPIVPAYLSPASDPPAPPPEPSLAPPAPKPAARNPSRPVPRRARPVATTPGF